MIKVWLLAIRPKTLAASISPVLLGSAMAYHFGEFNFSVFAATLLGALLLQMGSNLVNDFFDFKKGSDTIERKGPTRIMQAGLCTEFQMKSAIALVFVLALFFGAYLISIGGIVVLYIGLISIACAFLYTAGPYPLAYVGLGDLFVFVFFGPLAVCGTFFLQTGRWTLEPLLTSLPLGLISIGILTVNNVRDFAEDSKTQKRTLVVRFGQFYGRFQYSFCILLSLVLPIIYSIAGLTPVLAVISFPLLFLAVPMIKTIWRQDDGVRLNILLAQTGRFLLLFGFTQSLSWLF